MESSTLLPRPEMDALPDGSTPPEAEITEETCLVPAVHAHPVQGGLLRNARLSRLAVELDVAIPVRDFRVRNLLALAPGSVIQTQWQQGEDLPLATRGAQLAWSEFEVIDEQLAVRITRLA
jgi:flagellar motor switch protein FliN/FliY